MRSFPRFAAGLGLSLVALTVATTIAEAQNRRGPLRVTVQKRSYFDAGNVVAVGSMDNYARQHMTSASPVYSSTASWYGEGTLPSAIGSGRNPFANTFSTPRF
jgi:hypothetical protein